MSYLYSALGQQISISPITQPWCQGRFLGGGAVTGIGDGNRSRVHQKQWRRLHGTRGRAPHFYKWLGTGAPRVWK